MPRGGRREGAGRPATLGPLTPVTVRLTEKDVKLLNRLTKRHEADGPTGAIRAALRVAARPVQPAPSGDVGAGAAVEVLCKAIAAIGAGDETEARGALAELGKAMGFSASDKRKVTSALTKARESLEAAGKASGPEGNEAELPIDARTEAPKPVPSELPKAIKATGGAPSVPRDEPASRKRTSSLKAWYLIDGVKSKKKRVFVVVAANKREAVRLSHSSSIRSFDLTWTKCSPENDWYCASERGPGTWVMPGSENFPTASKFKPVKLMPVF